MAIAMRGLKVKPSYEQLVGVATSYGLGNMKFRNRGSTFFKKWFYVITTWWGGHEANAVTAGTSK